MKKPNIELKNIKHFAAQSEETHCFTATLYVDGQKFALIGNHGHGGPDNIDLVKGKTWEDFKALEKRIAATFPKWGSEFGGEDDHDCSLEILCGELINDFLEEKQFRRLLKKPTYINSEGHIMQFKAPPKGVPMAKMIDAIKAKRPEISLLNEMPEAEAFALLKKVA